MDLLRSGTSYGAPEGLVAPGESPGTPIVVEQGLGELPHGYLYTGYQGDARLQLTAYDPDMLAVPGVAALLESELAAVTTQSYDGIVPTLGTLHAQGTLICVRQHPARAPLRRFIERRIEQRRAVSPQMAASVGVQLCNILAQLHPDIIHGYLTPDTVYLGKTGRVSVGAVGEGRILPYGPGFDRFRAAGLLTMAAPELLERDVPEYTPATDVYGVAAVVFEVLTGRPVPGAGTPLRHTGAAGDPGMHDVIERALAPSPDDRWSSVGEFAAYLEQWAGAKRSITPLSVSMAMPLPPGPPPGNGHGHGHGHAGFGSGSHSMPLPPPPIHGGSGSGNLDLPPPPESGSFIVDPTGAYDPPLVSGVPGSQPPPPPSAPPKRKARPEPKPGRTPPKPPPPPSKPKKANAPDLSGDWGALDLATKRLLESDGPADSLTTGLADHLAPASASPPSSAASSGHGDLGLALDRFDDAADRLETLDGESGLLGLAELGGRHGDGHPADTGTRRALAGYATASRDQGYFGSLSAEGDDSGRSNFETTSSLVSDDNPSVVANRNRRAKVWVLTRNGVDHAPCTIVELETRARKGELVSTDRVREGNAKATLAVDVPELRNIFEEKLGRGARPATPAGGIPIDGDLLPGELRRGVSKPAPSVQARTAAQTSSARSGSGSGSGSGWGTLVWVLVAIAGFAAAAWVMYQRSSGG